MPRVSNLLNLLGVLALFGACLQPASQICGNGAICPPGFSCVDTGSAAAGRVCAAGSCGDGRRDDAELCDDGNNRSGDGCPADCTAPCGDGVRDPRELCDDGNKLSGDGCSADCLSLDGVFLISPAAVQVAALEGAPLPSPVTVKLRFAHRGDTVLVGYPAGTASPAWLSITERALTPTTAEIELAVSDTSSVGVREATVQLTILRQDGSAGGSFFLPVTYAVAPTSDLMITAAPSALVFSMVAGGDLPPPRALAVAFNGESATLESAPPWLSISPPADPQQSPASFELSVSERALPAGTILTGEAVFRTKRGSARRSAIVALEHHVVAPPTLAIAAEPDVLAFTAISGGALPSPRTLSVTFEGDLVEVVAAPPWMTVSGPLPSSVVGAKAFSLAVNTTDFATGTTQSGSLTLRATQGLSEGFATVPLTYAIVAPPILEYVAPYVGVAGRAGALIVRGRGFPTSGSVTVHVGAHELAPVQVDSSTQLRLSYPALPVGRYPMTMLTQGAAEPGAPQLVVVAPVFGYQALTVFGRRTTLVYDAERAILLGVNPLDQRLERFAHGSGGWSALPPLAVPEIVDLALAPDGRSALILQKRVLAEMSLTDGQLLIVPRASLSDPSCNTFTSVVSVNDGKVHALTRFSGSGHCPSYLYDLRSHTLTASTLFNFSRSAGSADGSRVYIADVPSGVSVYDSLSGMTSLAAPLAFNARRPSVSEDASRALFNLTEVRDRDLQIIGKLPFREPGDSLISRDGRRAFVYVQDTSGARLEIYDLEAPLEAGAYYPLLRTVPLLDAANAIMSTESATMTSTPDDSIVFISGDRRLLIVPLSGGAG